MSHNDLGFPLCVYTWALLLDKTVLAVWSLSTVSRGSGFGNCGISFLWQPPFHSPRSSGPLRWKGSRYLQRWAGKGLHRRASIKHQCPLALHLVICHPPSLLLRQDHLFLVMLGLKQGRTCENFCLQIRRVWLCEVKENKYHAPAWKAEITQCANHARERDSEDWEPDMCRAACERTTWNLSLKWFYVSNQAI